jgi:hypothetical protein
MVTVIPRAAHGNGIKSARRGRYALLLRSVALLLPRARAFATAQIADPIILDSDTKRDSSLSARTCALGFFKRRIE